MEFAILFILAFLIGLFMYMFSNQWMLSVGVTLVLFFVNIVSDTAAQSNWAFSLIFGLPIVFVGSLLGPYIVELRRGEVIAADSLDEGAQTDSGNEGAQK